MRDTRRYGWFRSTTTPIFRRCTIGQRRSRPRCSLLGWRRSIARSFSSSLRKKGAADLSPPPTRQGTIRGLEVVSLSEAISLIGPILGGYRSAGGHDRQATAHRNATLAPDDERGTALRCRRPCRAAQASASCLSASIDFSNASALLLRAMALLARRFDERERAVAFHRRLSAVSHGRRSSGAASCRAGRR